MREGKHTEAFQEEDPTRGTQSRDRSPILDVLLPEPAKMHRDEQRWEWMSACRL